jgi:hypothetical protein
VIEKGSSVVTFYGTPSHVRYVEESHCVSDRQMLRNHPFIIYWVFKLREVDEMTMLSMKIN